MSGENTTRREWLQRTGVVAAATLFPGLLPEAQAQQRVGAPTSAVALARCDTYDVPKVTEQLTKMMDQLGGIRSLVAGKTVGVKFNLTGSPGGGMLGLPASRTYQIHPAVAQALAIVLDRAGAHRIRFLEGTYTKAPIERTLHSAGWDLQALSALHAKVEYEDTRNAAGKPYSLLRVPGGGDLFPAYKLNHSYTDCDVFISLAKLKNHVTAGVTLSMKNCFGITPMALYGNTTADESCTENRLTIIHAGQAAPAAGVPQELHPDGPRVPSYRVPRHIVDIVRIRPIDLALIDGIETISGGEGPWYDNLALQKPHLLIAGRNPVCTDAIATVCMGYDPQAVSATGTFPGDNHLAMAAQHGVGTNDPARIEVVGLPIAQAKHPFHWEPAARNT